VYRDRQKATVQTDILMAMTYMRLLSLNICCATNVERLLSLDFMSHVWYSSGNKVHENDKHRYG